VSASIAALRDRLIGEHLGVVPARVRAEIARTGSIGDAIEALRGDGHTLMPLEVDRDSWIDMVMPDTALLDPERPVGMNDLIAELAPNDLAALRSPLERTAIALAAVAGVAALWYALPASTRTSAFGIDAWLAPWRESGVAPLVASACVALGGMWMAPLALLSALCGFVFGPWIGFAAAYSGAVIGAVAGYALGAGLRRETVRRLVGRSVDRLSRQLRAGGRQAILALRLLPLAPYAAVNLVAGAVRFRPRDFLVPTLLAMAPGTLLLALIGDAAADAIRAFGSRPLVGATAIALAMIAAMLGIRRGIRIRTRERRAIA
jgi:uncharacterized membrane protein YdjX (TVP38/TMEM64 family)